jgi:NodT family efflux transporter outer membrane factor (OMF) lipoprotein
MSRLAVLVAAFLVSACSLGPAYQEPKVAMPSAWAARVEGAGAWPDRQWWRSFGSPELDELIVAARANNRDLAAAVARIRQADAQARIARAALLPTVSADGGATRTWQSRSGLSSSGASTGSSARTAVTSYDASLVAAYQVDVFGGNAAAAAAAGPRLESSRLDRDAVMITLHASVATTYLQLLSIRDRLDIAAETLQIAEEVLGLLIRQRDIGVVTDLEVSQQRGTVATQRAAYVGIQQSERVTLDALAVLAGRPPQGFGARGQSLAELTLPRLAAGMPSELLQRRPDIRKAEADLRAANFDIAAARADRFPSFDLSAGASLRSTMIANFLDPTRAALSLGAAIAAPIFEGGRLKAQEDLADARYRELIETYHQAILAALRDIEDALGAGITSREQYDYALEAYQQAREAYRIADARYRAGTVNFLSVLDAQRTMFQSNDAMVQSSLARYSSVVDLYKALGGGWDGGTNAAR